MRALSMLLASCAWLGGCSWMVPAPVPMRSIDYAQAAEPAQCLFVLLPGLGDRAGSFAQRGFIDELRGAGRSIDIRAVDATLGYYIHDSFLERLAVDVMAPLRARGYEEVWLVGPSMGAFGSLFYARANSPQITGVLAIAPYLGDKSLIGEIEAAGGLRDWQAPEPVDELDRDNYQRELWRWLQAVTAGQEDGPLLFAGYGRSDKFRVEDGLLAAALPPSRVFLTDGKHEWPAWRRVLQAFLASPEFATHCRRDSTGSNAR